jgi:hypothetical protein
MMLMGSIKAGEHRMGRPTRFDDVRAHGLKVVGQNPHRPGTSAAFNFEVCKTCGMVQNYLNLGGDSGYLQGYIADKLVQLVPPIENQTEIAVVPRLQHSPRFSERMAMLASIKSALLDTKTA